MNRPTPHRGFTLIEVMVALSIVAIALIAGTQATSALTHNAQRQSDVMLAQICAENQLIALRLVRQFPSVGDITADCEQGGKRFNVLLIIRPTPNPSFRRVDAQVLNGDASILRISTVIGRY